MTGLVHGTQPATWHLVEAIKTTATTIITHRIQRSTVDMHGRQCGVHYVSHGLDPPVLLLVVVVAALAVQLLLPLLSGSVPVTASNRNRMPEPLLHTCREGNDGA